MRTNKNNTTDLNRKINNNGRKSAAAPCAPSLNGEPIPHVNNMGGIDDLQNTRIDVFVLGVRDKLFNDGTEQIRLENPAKGVIKTVRIPSKDKGANQRAGFIDQLSFTIDLRRLKFSVVDPDATELQKQLYYDRVVNYLSGHLIKIFGFGVTSKRNYGLNRYKYSFELGGGLGFLCIGGDTQRNTVNIAIHGQGIMKASDGWARRLYNYMCNHKARFTRVDVAADIYDGSYTPQQAEIDHENGLFSLKARSPDGQRVGVWNSQLKGKTYQVGHRANGKTCRVYEKLYEILGYFGISHYLKNPGDMVHGLEKWTRIEVEWHNKDREIPLDILLHPGQYLAGSYPAFSFLATQSQNVKTTKKHRNDFTVERVKANVRRQCGSTMHALIAMEGFEVIFDLMKTDKEPSWYSSIQPLKEAFVNNAAQWFGITPEQVWGGAVYA